MPIRFPFPLPKRLVLAVAVGLSCFGCKGNRGATMPHFLGDDRNKGIDPSTLDPKLAAKWETLRDALAKDPAAAEIGALADDVLNDEPPVPVQVDALRAKALNAYALGRDLEAVGFAEEGLRRAGPDGGPAEAVVELVAVRLRALVRGGDPVQALEALNDPRVRAIDDPSLDEVALAGLHAVALDRNAAYAPAVGAYARWRERVADDGAEALYAEERLHALAPSLDASEIGAVARELPKSHAQHCLMALTGVRRPVADDPGWVKRCGRRPDRIGVLLPRTGPLSALADTQLGAASIAVATLARGEGRPILWRDAGATPQDAVRGARGLIAAGADAIVGPIGPGPIDAVTGAFGDRIEIVVPGEGRGRAKGVAPTLEARLQALVADARSQGAKRFLVIAPDAGYGRRAIKAIRGALEAKEAKGLIVQTYPPSTTSFSPVLAPLVPAFRGGTALLIADHMNRVELVVRQLVRSGHAPAPASTGLLVLTTGEGADADALARGRKVFDHVRIAPTAFPTEAAGPFVDAYRSAQGEAPGDQALLVFYAFRRALLGDAAPTAPHVLRVEDGSLVR